MSIGSSEESERPSVSDYYQRSLRMVDVPAQPIRQVTIGDHHQNANNNMNRTGTNNFHVGKVSRAKKSKIRYLTRQEIVGISLSALLSVFICSSAIFILHQYAAFVMMYIVNTFNSRGPSYNLLMAKMRLVSLDQNLTYSNFSNFLIPQLFGTSTSNLITSELILNKLGLLDSKNLYSSPSNKFQSFSINLVTTEQIYRDNRSLDNDINKINFFDYLHTNSSCNWMERCDINDIFKRIAIFETNANEINSVLESEDMKLEIPIIGNVDNLNNIKNNKLKTNITISVGKNSSHLSGTSFHVHKASFNELLYGKKRWVFYNADKLPPHGFNPYENLESWHKTVYPLLHQGEVPIELTQNAGEVVFIPEGWYHATTTISDISISMRYTLEREDNKNYFYYLSLGNKKSDLGDYVNAIKWYKLGLGLSRNCMLLESLAVALVQIKSYSEAEETYRELILKNPRNPANYAELINLLISYSSKDSSAGIAEIISASEKYGIREQVLFLSSQTF
eukprot:gene14073-18882_t